MAPTIRRADPMDVPSLDVIRRQALEAGFTDQYRRSDFVDLVATSDDRLSDWVAADETLVLVVATDFTPAAFGVYEIDSARILALYTAPEYQGGGRASALLDRFERRARTDGKRHIRAVVPSNAVDFFERRGFEPRRVDERDGLSMVVVSKPITRPGAGSRSRGSPGDANHP